MSETARAYADQRSDAPAPARWPEPPPPLGVAGNPAPTFAIRSSRNPAFDFGTLSGRYVALCFFGPASELGLSAIRLARDSGLFADECNAYLAVVATEPGDEAGLPDLIGPHCIFWDHDLAISRQFAAVPQDAVRTAPYLFNGHWLLLDPMLRTLKRLPLSQTKAFLEQVRTLPAAAEHAGSGVGAPVLTVARIFEPEFCRALIELYQGGNPVPSGFMVERDGRTVGKYDDRFKRRHDCWIDDRRYVDAIRQRLSYRLFPEIFKAFQFRPAFIERYIVACYDAAHGGFFRPHRDNTMRGTAHRQFAVTINLNEEAYEGGDLVFPEFGDRTYRAPTGAAIVFSCSLLHEARPVTRGQRFACLPFLFDEAHARIAQENVHLIETPGGP